MNAVVAAEQFSNERGVRRAIERSLAMLRPPPKLLPSQYAEAKIRIPEGNAKPGPYRLANAPFQEEPMNMLIDPDCFRMSLMWGAQTGKTMVMLVQQVYCIEISPRSQMAMQPSQNDSQIWLETKFQPIVDASENLRKLIAKPRGREGVNNQRMKSYPGGYFMTSWAGSTRTMRGRSAPYIGCDEVDGYKKTEEGHPVGLLWQRAATFGDLRFLCEISTPTIKEHSYIETAFLDGDQRRFYIVCPDCHAHQVLKWANITWIGRLSTCVEDATADLAHDDHETETARYTCEACGSLWNDGQRIAAIRNAKNLGAGWKAAKPFKGHASFHIWEAYSTFRKLADIVRDYLDKVKADNLQTFVNVSLSETFEIQGDRVDPSGLVARAEVFFAVIPMGGLFITMGIDMQIDRLEVETVVWGEGDESWSIEYKVLWGDPLGPDVWEDLDDHLAQEYAHESGAILTVGAACMDTGGTNGCTQAAYEYLRGKTGRRLFGIKGIGGWGRPIVEKMQRKQSGKKARKVDLFLVGVDEAKLVVMRRFGNLVPGPGYCHLPSDRYDLEEWAKQVTAEKMVIRYVKGQPIREWRKPDKARNEALDCRVYALAALKIIQPNFKRIAERLEKHPRAKAAFEALNSARKTEGKKPMSKDIVKPDPAAEALPEKEKPQEAPRRPVTQTKKVIKSPGASRKRNWVTGWQK